VDYRILQVMQAQGADNFPLIPGPSNATLFPGDLQFSHIFGPAFQIVALTVGDD
jgi:hypothetical protein